MLPIQHKKKFHEVQIYLIIWNPDLPAAGRTPTWKEWRSPLSSPCVTRGIEGCAFRARGGLRTLAGTNNPDPNRSDYRSPHARPRPPTRTKVMKERRE